TGLGLTDRTGVTVIAGDCLTADSLDTAINVMGPKAGLELIDNTPGTAAFIVRATDHGPELYESRQFKTFVVAPPNDQSNRPEHPATRLAAKGSTRSWRHGAATCRSDLRPRIRPCIFAEAP
ncbi:MAG TPA: FAD:protein FMN transferase, partial [Pirellulales bacterium]|nr:FAD:protein FMN transferase [Pirellulales bacterium]